MKTEYRHFTQAQREQARSTDLVSLLQGRGEALKRSGREYQWQDGTQKVTVRGNLWFHQYERVGGDAVDFVRRFYGLDYPQAVEFLLGSNTLPLIECHSEKERPEFQLPAPNDNLRRVAAYLVNRRGIDRDIFYAFVRRGMIYESAQHHNAVFVGFDSGGVPRHAHLRGCGGSFKGNAAASDPQYSFHWSGSSDRLYLFEAPIDLLSFLSLHKENWQQHSYAAACCVGDAVLFRLLADQPAIRTVALCMDSDAAGQVANRRIAKKLEAQNIAVQCLVPSCKDWNEVLCVQRQGEKLCQTLSL